MISHDYRCIFIHIPKVAGQSIEHFFLDLHGLDWDNRASLLLRHNPDPSLGPVRLAHLTAREYVECGHIGQADFDAYFKFAFVRNPWERLVSEYRYRRHQKKFSFREFVLKGLPEPDPYRDSYRHIIPQHDYLHDSQGRLMVDFVGRYENLQADFGQVCERLGLPDSRLPHVNSAAQHSRGLIGKMLGSRTADRDRRHYSEYYDDELRREVGEIYARDIAAFGYEFDPGMRSHAN